MTYATIFDLDGHIAADGLQTAATSGCQEARRTAENIARRKRRSVIVEDRGTRNCYRITPSGNVWKPPTWWTPSWETDEDR